MIEARAELVHVPGQLLGGGEVLEVRSGFGSGTFWRNAAAIGSMRFAGIWLFGNGVQTPVVGMVSGSQMVPRPAKLPLRAAAVGTEKTSSGNGEASCLHSCRRRTSGSGRRGRRSTPPNWFCRSGGSGWFGRLEKVARVERLVAVELEDAAAERVRAGLGHHVDERRRLATELRGIHRLLDLELLDGIDRGVEHEIVEELVRDLRAVHQIDVVAGALAADVRELAGLAKRAAARSARGNHHGVAELRERHEVSPVERQLHDLPVFDDVADLRVGRLQEGSRRPTLICSATPFTLSVTSICRLRPISTVTFCV